jgi:hypothetical protein
LAGEDKILYQILIEKAANSAAFSISVKYMLPLIKKDQTMKRALLICSLFIGITAASFAQTTKPTTDPVQKAKGLQKQLSLTDVQTTKVASVYEESAKKFEKIKVAEHGNTDKMTTAMGPLRAETMKKIKTLLTPAQAVKYDKLVKDTKNTGGSGWSDGWSPASSSN